MWRIFCLGARVPTDGANACVRKQLWRLLFPPQRDAAVGANGHLRGERRRRGDNISNRFRGNLVLGLQTPPKVRKNRPAYQRLIGPTFSGDSNAAVRCFQRLASAQLFAPRPDLETITRVQMDNNPQVRVRSSEYSPGGRGLITGNIVVRQR